MEMAVQDTDETFKDDHYMRPTEDISMITTNQRIIQPPKKPINYTRLNQLYSLGRQKLIKGLLNETDSKIKKEQEEL